MIPLGMVVNGVSTRLQYSLSQNMGTNPSSCSLPRRSRRLISLNLLAFILRIALLTLAFAPNGAFAAPGTWSPTGSMHDKREEFTATLLRNGKVLVAGGFYMGETVMYTYLSSAELYDPSTGTWTSTGNMLATRSSHEASLLNDGRVLVAGGYAVGAEIYDPNTGTWSSTDPMVKDGRYGHTVSLLANGNVLVAGGGRDVIASMNNAEIYDPATNQWTTTGSMNAPRRYHTATLLSNGQVLVVGGLDQNHAPIMGAAELYDPGSGTWSPVGTPKFPRAEHTATLLPDGRVLIVGGYGITTPMPEIYDPTMESFSDTALPKSGFAGTATLLDNSKVLVARGIDYISELYDLINGTWNVTGSMTGYRDQAVLLRNGKVLAVGGTTGGKNSLNSAELYDPDPPPAVKLPALMAFYPFDGSPNDTSGNRLHGQAIGTPQLVAGYQGQAYSFNGSTDYITAPVDINPDRYPRLTMGAWVKQASTFPLQQLLTHDNGDFDRSLSIDFRGAGIGWSAFCGPTGQVLGAMQGYMNTWTFVVVVYDQVAQTVKLMVDNQIITKTGVTLGSGQNELYIGASPLFNVFLAGTMDNVFLFGDVLTNQQLAYIRSEGAQALMTVARRPNANPGLLLLLLDN